MFAKRSTLSLLRNPKGFKIHPDNELRPTFQISPYNTAALIFNGRYYQKNYFLVIYLPWWFDA